MTTRVFLTSGTSWVVPLDWDASNNTIHVVGKGGNGAATTVGGGGGGGGGYSSTTNLSASPGDTLTFSIGGAGADTWISNTGVAPTSASEGALAKGGANASGATAGAGGSTTGAIGSTTYAGGSGGAGGNASNGSGGGAMVFIRTDRDEQWKVSLAFDVNARGAAAKDDINDGLAWMFANTDAMEIMGTIDATNKACLALVPYTHGGKASNEGETYRYSATFERWAAVIGVNSAVALIQTAGNDAKLADLRARGLIP